MQRLSYKIIALALVFLVFVLGSNAEYPSDVIPYINRWKITLPVDENGDDSTGAEHVDDRNNNAYEVKRDDLIDYEYEPYFYAEDDEVVFMAHCGGATTSGSKYPRSELRQEVGGGSNYWSVYDYQYLETELRITETPVEKPEVSVVQIHGPEDEPLRVQYYKGKGVYLIYNEDFKTDDQPMAYSLGQRLKVSVTVENGRIYCSLVNLDTADTFDFDWESIDQTGYFKVGMYTQSSMFLSDFKSGKEDENPDAAGEVRVRYITLVESYQGSTTSYPGESASSQYDVQQAFRNLIISEHNRVRSEVNPSASTPLTALTYSTAIESNAKAHVEQCEYGNDSSSYGKNLHAVAGNQIGNLDFTQHALSTWEEEKNAYTLTSTSGTCANNENCSAYVQMVWDHASYPTTVVGCAIALCNTGSPWGTGHDGIWTMLYCNYGNSGNQIGLLPYVPVGSSTSCEYNCTEDDCGTVSIDCGDFDCGCCDEPCSVHECGTHINACQETINCGSCSNGSSCEAGSNGNVCVEEPVCSHEEECASNNRECDYSTYCSITESCGQCSEGERCVNFQCEEDPCFGCPANSECADNSCVCLDGFVQDSVDNCIASSSGGGSLPDYTNMVHQIYPDDGTVAFTVAGTDIILNNDGPHVLDWSSTLGVVDAYTTNSEVTVSIASGEFGFNLRTGQTTNPLDCLRWHVKDIGSSPRMSICFVWYGKEYCGNYQYISFPTSDTTVRVTMGFDDATNNILTTFRVNGGEIWSTAINQFYYPDLGSISFYLAPSIGHTASLSQAILATTTTMTISLSECIDDSEWEDIFYQLSGADPATTSVAIRGDNDQTDCEAKSLTGKALVSGFTTVITSGSVAASSLSSTVASSTGSAGASIFGISSAATVPGAAGASAAGFPTSVAALGGSIVQTPGVVSTGAGGAGGAAAGGGGGSSGLSGGTIAGIVVGSVAGGLLILGAASIVVVTVVVAAVVIATKDDKEEAPQRAERPKSVRKTIKSFFGGVDVMANDPNARQSITQRSPGF